MGRKAQQRLNLLWRLKRAGLSKLPVTVFYRECPHLLHHFLVREQRSRRETEIEQGHQNSREDHWCPAVVAVGDLQPEMHTQRGLHHQGPLSSLSQSLLSDAGMEAVQEHSDEDILSCSVLTFCIMTNINLAFIILHFYQFTSCLFLCTPHKNLTMKRISSEAHGLPPLQNTRTLQSRR